MDGNTWLKALNALLTLLQRLVLLSGWIIAAVVLGLLSKDRSVAEPQQAAA